jgi:hypothetical protein
MNPGITKVSIGTMNPGITKVSIGTMNPIIGLIRLLIGGTNVLDIAFPDGINDIPII